MSIWSILSVELTLTFMQEIDSVKSRIRQVHSPPNRKLTVRAVLHQCTRVTVNSSRSTEVQRKFVCSRLSRLMGASEGQTRGARERFF